MKRFIILLASIILSDLCAYPEVVIHNSTPFQVKGRVDYTACRHDSFDIRPYGKSEPFSRGACLLTSITAKVTETANGLEQLGYGTSQANLADVDATPYESSGTSYSQFFIGGPIMDGTQRSYYVSRLVQ